MQYQVRTARITDVERIVAMLDAVADRPGTDRIPPGSGDLLRQLVGLPHAVVLVAESGRRLAGAAVLALYPSVALGGFVGSIDVLVVDPTLQAAGVRGLLVDELLRSGRNKGCVAIETAPADDPAERERWAESGFLEADRRMVRSLARIGAPPA
ncbi:MAG: GNAT family N-acetyltransferase [Candidatus Limnocylindrales bacterium]